MDRRTALGLLGAAALVVPLSGCGSSSAGGPVLAISDVGRAPQGDPVRSTLSGFSARLLDAMPKGNVVLSPASIAVVLAMLGNGAAARTRTQFETVLGSSIDALNVELNGLGQRLAALDGQHGTQLTFTNALWLQSGMTFQKPFLDALKKWYGTGAHATDFRTDPSAAVKAINTWCSTSTKGLIPSIVDTSMITDATRVVAGNAVHVKGSWKQPFMEAATHKAPFRTRAGAEVSVDMMSDSLHVPHLATPQIESIALPFTHPDLAFVVAVPTGPLALSGVPDLTAVLDAPAGMLMVSMPTFHAAFEQSLKTALTGLGLVDAWEEVAADFSAATGDRSLVLNFVQHKALITVDERGAEGAAVTVGGVGETSLPPSFVVDRPFFWAIVHVPTQSLVLLGREEDPTR